MLAGGNLRQWALKLGRAAAAPAQVEAIWEAIAKQAAARDAVETLANPVPDSIEAIAKRIFISVLAALGAFIIPAYVQSWTHSWAVYTGSVGASVVMGVILRRKSRWPTVGLAWLLGSIASPIVAGIAILGFWLS